LVQPGNRNINHTPASDASERTVDITTIGARTGRPRRIEVWFYRVDGQVYLKHGILAATGTPVRDVQLRSHVFASVIDDLNQPFQPCWPVPTCRTAQCMARR
jgi:hypothetical protein